MHTVFRVRIKILILIALIQSVRYEDRRYSRVRQYFHHSSVFLVTNPSVHLLFRLPPVCLREETVPQSHQLAPGPEQITNHI